MKLFLKILLLSSSLLFIESCGTINVISSPKLIAERGIHAPLEFGYNTALYKAKVKLFGKFYSGLFLFKYYPETKTHNIVFLSEIGLTLFEVKYTNNNFVIVKKSALFDNDKAINTFMNDLELLIQNIEDRHNAIFVCDTDNKRIKRARRNRKVYYFFNENNQIFRIKRNSFFNSVDVLVNQYDNEFPTQLLFTHKGIKLNIDLTLLKIDYNVTK